MSLTLTPPPPSLASPSRYTVAGASSSAARPPTSRPRVSCLATCHAPPPSSSASIAELEPPRRGERLSLYEILRVRENASAREIKAAYRALAKAYHPDAAAGPDGGGQDFIEIHKAYETLSDPAARAVYDLSLGSRSWRRGAAVFCPSRRWETDQCW
ncbi:chaperone protein dnaJ 11, chloroplastic-like [Rhodamnia argentea]|uniref:Chaperone protein dnaJ 11, chloroplastic-like n=1 Tax=Rhodamnia argentea TaxID=178133 RepID=A0A8B8QRR5_9MYRT|nr:chaperone protein dnaJ 11, chloroplastic-like [Rhodamnia argentea]